MTIQPAGRGARSSFDRVLAAVEAAGLRHTVTHGGNHIKAECPTHDDNSPSLSIDYKHPATLIRCFASCDIDDILAGLGLTTPMLFDDYEDPEVFIQRRAREREEERKGGRRMTPSRPKRVQVEKTRPALPKGRLPGRVTKVEPRPLSEWSVTTTYDYCDVEGLVIHQEVRHQRSIEVTNPETGEVSQQVEKRFTQRWPDNKGGWVEKTPAGFVPVLYRLPDLAGWIAEGRSVWLCEGVKDAERFLELGEAATTNPSGAGNFKPEQAAALAGAHVTAVLDHDLAGYRRGLKLASVLTEVASLRVVLPVTLGLHEDASDHFDAGHGLEDFVDVTLEELRLLEQVATAEEAARAAKTAAAEARARAEIAATGGARANDELRFAGRWAAEAGKHLVKAWEALQTSDSADEDQAERLLAAVRSCQDSTIGAHETAGIAAGDDLQQYLGEIDVPAAVEEDVVEDEGEGEGESGRVVEHPTSARMPDPAGQIATSKGHWAYELGGRGRRRRGVYQLEDNRWAYKAPLPYIHARVTARDGFGRPTGTHYLVSAQPDSIRVLIGHDELSRQTWPNILGLAAPYDTTIMNAATTALVNAARDEADEVEATPQLTPEGKISQAIPETLPPGYLVASPIERAEALQRWAEIVRLATESPRMAMVLGAAAFGPFQGATGRQPHIVSLHGDAAQGKSVTLRTAGSIWGYPGGAGDAGLVESWNQSGQGPISYLGMLGVLPAFFDESAMAGKINPEAWGKQIYDICNGASRGRPAAAGRLGYHRGRGWYGIMFSAGNGRLLANVGAGGFAGSPRRVVELGTPFTQSETHSDAIEGLSREVYGHLGIALLEANSTETAQRYLAFADDLLGEIDTDDRMAYEIRKHLVSHIAGAAMIDDLVGTHGLLAAAAADGAVEYLAEWEAPLHDADRLLEAIHDSLFQEPACWPTVAQHIENTQAPTFGDSASTEIARHGVALKTKGLVSNNEEWLGVFPTVWTSLCNELGVDSDVACRELTKRGVLIRQGSSNKPGARNFTSVVNVGRGEKRVRLYKLAYPQLDGPENDEELPLEEGPSDGGPDAQSTTDEPVIDRRAFSGSQGNRVTASADEVTARVTAADVPLTCGVTAVTGVTASRAHVGAHASEIHFPGAEPTPDAPAEAPSGEVLTKLENLQPCDVCGEPTGYAVNGVVVHGGDCVDQLTPSKAPVAQPSNEAPEHRKTTEGREARFTAPAACIDAESIHLADGTTRPFPEISHIGDLALLTGREQLRLGWGGGEDRLPDQGQIWLYPDALERLGFPTEMPLPAKALTKSQRAKETQKLFSKLDDHPLVSGALEAGWHLGQGGHMDVWTRIWHPELLPAGALLVGLSWHRIEGVALFEDHPAPAELSRRLLLFARHVGVSYRITSAATGLDLIDHHRPPRRSIDDDKGASRGRVALIRKTAAELPGWRANSKDARFAGLEQDFSWWRAWDSLPESERGRRYVHGYDRNASYLVPWRSIDLGVEDLIHRTGDAAAWDGKEKPGYYLIDANYEWPSWGLPDPGTAAGARVGGGKMWVTVHTLRQLKAHGIAPRVHESYTWGVTARYLEGPGTALGQARMALIGSRDAGELAVLATIKALYSATVGKLAEREHYADFHLWRPDWRDHVISATRTAILYTITKAQEISGEHPLVVDRDAVFYASDNPDPIAAWPGDPAKLGTSLGSWKPIGTADLQTWGPEYLPKRTGRWHYADAVAALAGDAR
ncbi:DUF927 domain-containing protein [Nocardioides limicola]|uniref:DUF927 domain-containing protein n=1 Tax=Nocardioides limicola TaxID=2803368 RepID=UPI00193B7404|nr:DUF927 domain-containing protein [Nocardioides sp. DJM-14]